MNDLFGSLGNNVPFGLLKLENSISVMVPALDQESTDDERVFGQVVRIHSGSSYEIQTK